LSLAGNFSEEIRLVPERVEKQALLDGVWKGAVVEENTLSRTISALREALGERGRERVAEEVARSPELLARLGSTDYWRAKGRRPVAVSVR
jgi:hypothetical protein